MKRRDIDANLKDVAFEYFYWFSRFEFALKESRYLKDVNPGAKAEPSWESFQDRYRAAYRHSAESIELLKLHPKRQVVSASGGTEWSPVGLGHCANDLCRVITMLRTIRNNLFHGGKHGDADVDSKIRNISLLQLGKATLDQLAEMAGFEADYMREY